jgi:hypothetical protein
MNRGTRCRYIRSNNTAPQIAARYPSSKGHPGPNLPGQVTLTGLKPYLPHDAMRQSLSWLHAAPHSPLQYRMVQHTFLTSRLTTPKLITVSGDSALG